MPIAEITSLIGSVKTAYDIAKGISNLKAEVERNQAVAEILKILLAVQADALSMQGQYQKLLQSKDELAEKLAEFEQWQKTESQYELQEVHRGIFVYSPKNPDQLKEPKHWLCANCWQERKKSVLQADYHHESAAAYTCPRCKTTIKMKFKNSNHESPIVPIRRRWMDF
jgi:rubrerythrin